MGEEKQETQGGTEAVVKPTDNAPTAQLENLLTRLAETISRIESTTLDDGEREKLELSRRLGDLERERERLGTAAREWEGRYKESQVRQLLLEAAASGGAYRPDQVVALLSGRVSWSEDGREPVLTLPVKGGPPAVFERSRFADGVKAFLAENPNLAAGSAGGGAGSRPSAPLASFSGIVNGDLGFANLPLLRQMRSELVEEAGQRKRSKGK